MTGLHLASLVPLLILFIVGLIPLFRDKGLLHITTLAYTLSLGYIASIGQWELVFIPLLIGVGIIELILFMACMAEGSWI